MEQYVRKNISKKMIERKMLVDKIMKAFFFSMTIISASMIGIIIIFIFTKGISPFLPNYEYGQVNLWNFLVGTEWRQDRGIYGVGFIVINTFISAIGALIIAFPISVLTALFIAKIAPKPIANFLRTVVELLAAIPSVVYGVFAAGTIVTFIQELGKNVGISTAGGNSLLAVILLLAIMIFPTITTIAETAIRSVQNEIELGSLALGATRTQTNFKVVLLSAKSGIFAGAILGIGRAFGEATAVSMVAGNKLYGPTFDLFDITRTLTTTMLSGLKETTGLDYDIRFSVGIVLMVVILVTNVGLNFIKSKVGNMK